LIYALSSEGRAQLDAIVATGALLAFDIDGTLAPIVPRRRAPARRRAALSRRSRATP
jgi:hypothetical protein